MYVYHVRVCCPWSPEESIGTPGAGVSDGVSRHVMLGTELGLSPRAAMTLNCGTISPAPPLLPSLLGSERAMKAALCHRFAALAHSSGDWLTLGPVSFPLYQWPAGGDQTPLWKPSAVPALTPVFLSLQIDFTADQIEGECRRRCVLLRFPEKE